MQSFNDYVAGMEAQWTFEGKRVDKRMVAHCMTGQVMDIALYLKAMCPSDDTAHQRVLDLITAALALRGCTDKADEK